MCAGQAEIGLGEAVEVFLAGAAQVGLPEQVGVGRDGAGVPQPQVLGWLAAVGQLADDDLQHGAAHDRQLLVPRPAGPAAGAAELLVQPGPGPDGDGAVLPGLRGAFEVGGVPPGRVGAGELRAVARRRAHLARSPGRGVAVEDPGGTQPDQQLHVMAGQGVGEVGGVVAGIEQDQRRVAGLLLPGRGQVLEQPGDLADRDVGVLLAGPQPGAPGWDRPRRRSPTGCRRAGCRASRAASGPRPCRAPAPWSARRRTGRRGAPAE